MLFALATSALSHAWFWSTPRRGVVAFDNKKTPDSFMDSESEAADEAQSKALSDRFNDAPEKESGGAQSGSIAVILTDLPWFRARPM
ncbi:TrbI F-type domain-containing protein [Klebsiella pneumoniae]